MHILALCSIHTQVEFFEDLSVGLYLVLLPEDVPRAEQLTVRVLLRSPLPQARHCVHLHSLKNTYTHQYLNA